MDKTNIKVTGTMRNDIAEDGIANILKTIDEYNFSNGVEYSVKGLLDLLGRVIWSNEEISNCKDDELKEMLILTPKELNDLFHPTAEAIKYIVSTLSEHDRIRSVSKKSTDSDKQIQKGA